MVPFIYQSPPRPALRRARAAVCSPQFSARCARGLAFAQIFLLSCADSALKPAYGAAGRRLRLRRLSSGWRGIRRASRAAIRRAAGSGRPRECWRARPCARPPAPRADGSGLVFGGLWATARCARGGCALRARHPSRATRAYSRLPARKGAAGAARGQFFNHS